MHLTEFFRQGERNALSICHKAMRKFLGTYYSADMHTGAWSYLDNAALHIIDAHPMTSSHASWVINECYLANHVRGYAGLERYQREHER